MARPDRLRRSCLAVPGSSERFLAKARGLEPDLLFLDLEDAVAPAVKADARGMVVEALLAGGFRASTIAVRVNDATTPWAHDDVVEVVRRAGAHVHCLVLPKVDDAEQVAWFDEAISRAEHDAGLQQGLIGIEVQVESARSLVNVEAIAAASERIESLVFGPADFMASIGMRSLEVGGQPVGYESDPFHYVHMRLLVAGRAFGRQVVDGPFLAIADLEGLRRSALRAAALGLDGKWAVHPSQIDVINEAFTPSQADLDRAHAVLAAYERATSADGGHRGAVMHGTEMLDEASRKVALSIAARGRAAGMAPTPA